MYHIYIFLSVQWSWIWGIEYWTTYVSTIWDCISISPQLAVPLCNEVLQPCYPSDMPRGKFLGFYMSGCSMGEIKNCQNTNPNPGILKIYLFWSGWQIGLMQTVHCCPAEPHILRFWGCRGRQCAGVLWSLRRRNIHSFQICNILDWCFFGWLGLAWLGFSWKVHRWCIMVLNTTDCVAPASMPLGCFLCSSVAGQLTSEHALFRYALIRGWTYWPRWDWWLYSNSLGPNLWQVWQVVATASQVRPVFLGASVSSWSCLLDRHPLLHVCVHVPCWL